MADMEGSERIQQIVAGALGNYPVGRTLEFEGSTITIPITAQLPNGWISTRRIHATGLLGKLAVISSNRVSMVAKLASRQ